MKNVCSFLGFSLLGFLTADKLTFFQLRVRMEAFILLTFLVFIFLRIFFTLPSDKSVLSS